MLTRKRKPLTLSLCLAASSPLWLQAAKLPALPEAVSNNLVLTTTVAGRTYVASFMGLSSGKTHADVHNRVWQWTLGEPTWLKAPAVPSRHRLAGRLGSTGVSLQHHFFIFGGYTVAANGDEVSSAEGYRYSPVTKSYNKLPDMPVAVDDSVALSYQNRYIYLASGWSQDGNVNLLQMFDNFTQKWSQATPFPGVATFGLAGAISGHSILLCDGIQVSYQSQPRQFEPLAQCWLGEINSKDASRINWQQIKHPTGKARYRMAAAAVKQENKELIVFIGGSETAYNYNGIGYNGTAAEPSAEVWAYSLTDKAWLKAENSTAVMDLRSLVTINNELYSLGGMVSGQNLTSEWIKHQIKLLPN
jgi:N-acetylneuraminic acid mutarotase